MEHKKHSALTIPVLILCAVMLVGAIVLIFWNMPKKQPAPVDTIDTASVFTPDSTAVEPDREEAYEGDLPAGIVTGEAALPTQAQNAAQSSSSELAAQYLAAMTPEEKLWQLFFIAPEALTGTEAVTEADDALAAALTEKPVGGVILFARNIETPAQTQALLSAMQAASQTPLLCGVDEEGGTVSRVGANSAMQTPKLDDMAVYGASGDGDALYTDLGNLAVSLSGLGFNLDFAPVADVAEPGTTMARRSFGSDPEACGTLVVRAVSALQDHNVAACLKHFPGYGSAAEDDHTGAVQLSRTLEQLEQTDFVPFSAGIAEGAYFVMVSHLSVPAVTGDDTPSDLSEKIVTELLRNTLHFQNVIITDAQNMGSITQNYTSGEAAVAALKAGADMILMPQDLQAAYDAVQTALNDGTLTQNRIDRSVLRILNVKFQLGLLPQSEPAQ